MPGLQYKPDWDKAQKRITAWWNGEVVDRVCLGVEAPADRPEPQKPTPTPPADPKDCWLDIDYRIESAEHAIQKTYYGGESIPFINCWLGPGSLAIYLGCGTGFEPDTIWMHPLAGGKEAVETIAYDPENTYWQWQVEFCRKATERARGKYLAAMPDLIENVDILASLRGADNLLMDFMMDPAFVHRVNEKLLELWFVYYDELYPIMKDPADGSVLFHFFNTWGPGRAAKVQCDLAPMISPDTFGEFVKPYIARQCARLDFTIFHMENPQTIAHIDHILDIPDLGAIQWNLLPSVEPLHHPKWFPYYERIREAGKSILLKGMDLEHVEEVVRALGPERLYITAKAPSESVARDVLRQATSWNKS